MKLHGHIIAAAALVLALLAGTLPAGAAMAAASGSARFDFETGDEGFVPIFADYPAGEGVDEFYELEHSWGAVPVEGAGNGLCLAGNNHSDDLFMGWYRELSGLPAGVPCVFRISFRIATNVEGGQFGVGGSPGSSVYVKTGIADAEPARTADDLGTYRLNIDKGNQGADGPDMRLVGDLTKFDSRILNAYEWKDFSVTVTAVPDENGRVWLALGTDSGFESLSRWWLDRAEVHWSRADAPTVSRGQAAELLCQAAGDFELHAPEFADVTGMMSCWYAVGWAQNKGIVTGCGGSRFAPEEDLTLEQALALLYRYSESPLVAGGEPISGVSGWAQSPAAWAVQSGFITAAQLAHGREPILLADYQRLLTAVTAE